MDYVAGRRNGYYIPNAPPNFINKPEPEPPKTYDVFKEEFLREMARHAARMPR